MRPRRLLALPLALCLALAAATPAMALDLTVGVTNFDFTPRSDRIDVGDTVTWRFDDSGHTSTAVRGQAQYWSSGQATVPSGRTFRRTFTRPGRFQYVCIPHASFMKGTIEVGTDQVAKTVSSFKSKRAGTAVTVSFRLNEAASVTYKLTGASRKTVRKGRLKAGRHSFKVKGLDEGSYAGTLTASDDFDKSAKVGRNFVVR